MLKIETIQERINAMIDKEIDRTVKEIDEFSEKIYDNSIAYGGGGWNTQFEKARERREKHLEELRAMKEGTGRMVLKKTVRIYPYYCPDCKEKYYLPFPARNRDKTITCPLCERKIYASAEYEEWEQVKGTHVAKMHNSFVDMEKISKEVEEIG